MGVKHSITHPARARVCWAVCSTAKSIYSFIPSKFFKASSRHVLLFKMLQKSKHLKIHGRSDLLTPINFHFPFLLIGAWRRISIPAPGRQTLQGAASGPQLRKPRRNAALCTRRALHGANRARLEELDQTLPSLAQLLSLAQLEAFFQRRVFSSNIFQPGQMSLEGVALMTNGDWWLKDEFCRKITLLSLE